VNGRDWARYGRLWARQGQISREVVPELLRKSTLRCVGVEMFDSFDKISAICVTKSASAFA
jgi:hypothetical protein